MTLGLQGRIRARWEAMDRTARGAALVSLDYSRIVYSAVLGYLVFGELPGPWSVAGMAIIVASSLHLVLTERKR